MADGDKRSHDNNNSNAMIAGADLLNLPIFAQLGIYRATSGTLIANRNNNALNFPGAYIYQYDMELDLPGMHVADVDSVSKKTSRPTAITVKFVIVYYEEKKKKKEALVHFYGKFSASTLIREVLDEYFCEMKQCQGNWHGKPFMPRFSVCTSTFRKSNSQELRDSDVEKQLSNYIDPLWGDRVTIICDCRCRKTSA
ncbi:hypothetical protein WR25_08236 [Diploscapter pachys]|uniref:Uncharacterized protein n=1 Tax=Diploscapter pachys TaxID=2018661 RepID=A0A2A2LHI0_9BILA|nr:hypothetical protein WR25_08236 [Diploscapter pachys]